MENRLFTAPELGEFFLGLVHFLGKKQKIVQVFSWDLSFFGGGNNGSLVGGLSSVLTRL